MTAGEILSMPENGRDGTGQDSTSRHGTGRDRGHVTRGTGARRAWDGHKPRPEKKFELDVSQSALTDDY